MSPFAALRKEMSRMNDLLANILQAITIMNAVLINMSKAQKKEEDAKDDSANQV